MQANGALVIQTLVGLNVWISQLVGTSTIGGYFLKLQDDSNLVIYDANNNYYWDILNGTFTASLLINYWSMKDLNDLIGEASLYGGSSYSFVPDRFGSDNSAIYFNQGYLQVPAGVYFSGDFTVTAWIYLKSYQYYSRIIDFGNEPNNDNIILAMIGTTSQIYGRVSQYFQTSSIINLNQWYFISFVLSGTTGYIYVNGRQVVTGSLRIPSNITRQSNYIGKSNWASDSNADAIYDEIKIFKGALTSNDILNEYIDNSLLEGDCLNQNEYIVSKSKAYQSYLSKNGNLILQV
jgi:hypothetical protein